MTIRLPEAASVLCVSQCVCVCVMLIVNDSRRSLLSVSYSLSVSPTSSLSPQRMSAPPFFLFSVFVSFFSPVSSQRMHRNVNVALLKLPRLLCSPPSGRLTQ